MNQVQSTTLLLGFGANIAGCWGSPRQTILRAVQELRSAGVIITGVSNLYTSEPVSDTPQPRYLNAVVSAEGHAAPGALLRMLKQLERRAGRRTARPLARRPLDIDILDYGGRRFGWPPGPRERGRLILPHPEMHRRAFVLVPLRDVAPAWRHPVLGKTVTQILAEIGPLGPAHVIPIEVSSSALSPRMEQTSRSLHERR